jgi:hypothetical protein
MCGIGESMIGYKSFPGLAGVFLEDSYVLGISESSEQFVFQLDAVLTPDHGADHSPPPRRALLLRKGGSDIPRRHQRRVAQTK